MNPNFMPRALATALPSGALGASHLKRVAERWLRRWVYALTGFALGLSGMWLTRAEVSEAHASASQAEAQMAQQLARMPSGAPGPTAAKAGTRPGPSEAQAQQLLSALPASVPPEKLWAVWQQALAAHGLRLQWLQPTPPRGTSAGHGEVVSHAAAWRALGRFDAWARLWAACADSGPVCAMERINVAPTDQVDIVQIDAVMRVWMRSTEGSQGHGAAAGETPSPNEKVYAAWLAADGSVLQQSTRSRAALFAPSHGASAVASAGLSGAVDGLAASNRAEGASSAVASLAALPQDPHQWPFSRVRLAGLWQQGGDHHAVLTAGSHSVRVTPGQRVTLEGHRVVAITGEGVRLRLGQGPWLPLPWAEARQALGAPGPSPSQMTGQSGGQSANESMGPLEQDRTTGSPSK